MDSGKHGQPGISGSGSLGQGDPRQEQGDGADGLCSAGNAQGRARTVPETSAERSRRSKVAREIKASQTPQEAGTTGDTPRSASSPYQASCSPESGETPEAGEASAALEAPEDPGSQPLSKVENRKKVQGRRASGSSLSRITHKFENEVYVALDETGFEGDDLVVAALMFIMLDLQTINADKIAKATGVNRDFCRTCFKRMRDNGIIVGPRSFHVQWFDEDSNIAGFSFILDALVAQGHIERFEEFTYKSAT